MVGRHARLEPLLAASHAAALFAANSEDKTGALWTYLGYGPFANLDAYVGWMEKTCGGEDPLFFAIIDVRTNKAVGVAAYLRIDPANGVIEIGHLAFAPALQRTTAATEAMYLMMETVFAAGYRRCEWKCDTLNAPSRAAAERLGFTFEGVFRQAAVVKGRNRDTAWYAIIDPDWPDIRASFQRWLAPENFDGNGVQRARLAARRNAG
jgi:RimJ/RimL family protein N-acetyltransferase